jgi:hypothetical protein
MSAALAFARVNTVCILTVFKHISTFFNQISRNKCIYFTVFLRIKNVILGGFREMQFAFPARFGSHSHVGGHGC